MVVVVTVGVVTAGVVVEGDVVEGNVEEGVVTTGVVTAGVAASAGSVERTGAAAHSNTAVAIRAVKRCDFFIRTSKKWAGKYDATD